METTIARDPVAASTKPVNPFRVRTSFSQWLELINEWLLVTPTPTTGTLQESGPGLFGVGVISPKTLLM